MSSMRASAQAWESLLRAQSGLMRAFEADGDFAPLSPREYDVLLQLAEAGPDGLRLGDLAEQTLLPQPSMSRMIDRLTSRGLVRRAASPGDRRGVLVVLTPAGADLQARAARRHLRSMHAYLGGTLTGDELDTLTRLCERLRDGVTAVGAQAPHDERRSA
ncbi:transcriptional regulator, MarR family [Beutenbergia cavernae DSM 12333]|uniref:Transcriptional regulator, MarR family n=1 Tax=Beutenbergia cavernae (strain ATCC BAA-8 / DSM 12333 / CCUG 43141 / JCM 11478 / NBRC 16432 / NCIMB 13614 / HKI 0122) TaxID=471853 RepID=C5C467_BEUC1|nr:MarR family transcriptional regulator [Beutenbergia cavernae]ACQ79980.1 transcriptional regulator, MarR family [Beutenbergia cavernae DSM 12333]